MENKKKNIIELLEKILNVKIQDIELVSTEYFNSIIEYEFSLFKVNVVYDIDKKKEIYLKMIKGGKIKETIFCFWSFLYEEYLKNNKDKHEMIQTKAIITQKNSNEDSSSIELILNQKFNYCAEINLIELKKFAIKNHKDERWVEELNIKSEDILFIGRKMY